VLFRLGIFEIRWYALAVTLAVTAAVLITVRQARKKGVESGEIYSLAGWVVLAGILGARLFHVIDHWEHYVNAPMQIFNFQGLAIWGALIGGGLALVVYSWKKHLPVWRLADVLVPGLLVAQIIGRVGCIVNGDAYGGITDLPWAFIYIHPEASIPSSLFAQPTHPYPAYEMLWNGLTLLLINRFSRYFRKDGLAFLTYLSLYSLGRIGLTLVRQERVFFGGLQQAQIVAMIVMAVSILVAVVILNRSSRREQRKMAQE